MNNLNIKDPFDEENDHDDKEDSSKIKFICPNCKNISRDDVIFLCNTCGQDELIYKNGIYMCPACLAPGENFECQRCGSKEVKMDVKEKKRSRT